MTTPKQVVQVSKVALYANAISKHGLLHTYHS